MNPRFHLYSKQFCYMIFHSLEEDHYHWLFVEYVNVSLNVE